jgi:homocysteine S-methyltransferase
MHLVVMPNAGGFQRIGNRFMTSVNPEFAGRMARRLMDRGVRLIGGCCEMHPPHIREMRNYLQSRVVAEKGVAITVGAAADAAGDEEKKGNGPFSRKIKEGRFAVSVEMLPPRGTDPKISERKVDVVRQLAECGLADAVDITDGSRGIPLMPPGDFVHLLRDRLGWTSEQGDRLELIPHFTGRDLNIMGLQSRLIGYHANRIHNVLFVTGDPPKMSPTYPRSTAVFDADSVALIRMTHGCLNAGVDFGGSPLGRQTRPQTHFTIGTGFEPESLDLERECKRLEEKLDAGADYVMTQPAFRLEPLAVLEPYRARVPILAGVMILTSYDQARRVAQVPGVVIPDTVLERMASGTSPDDQEKIGRDIAIEQVRDVVSEGWSGLYLMSPSNALGILDVLQAGL